MTLTQRRKLQARYCALVVRFRRRRDDFETLQEIARQIREVTVILQLNK